jgi:hypothetical protein
MNRKQIPPPSSPLTPEDLVKANAMRMAFGHPPHSKKNHNEPFLWPDEANQIFYGVERNLSHGFLRDHPGLKTLSAKSPADMTGALVNALHNGLLSLNSVTQFDQAWHRLNLLESTLRCVTDAFEMIHIQVESQEEEYFLSGLKRRIDFAQKTLKELREFVK